VERLDERNERVDAGRQAGFYGLDLYSLHRSMQEVITYLEKVDPQAAARARQRYSCFDHASADDDGQAYGFAAAFGAGQSCEQQAVDQLVEILLCRIPRHSPRQTFPWQSGSSTGAAGRHELPIVVPIPLHQYPMRDAFQRRLKFEAVRSALVSGRLRELVSDQAGDLVRQVIDLA
jgi:hypothetical protein